MEYDPTNLRGWSVISDTLPCTVSNALFNVDDVMYIILYCLFVIVITGGC